jgi:hypothetical protein
MRSAQMDVVVEAARANRNIASVLCDLLAERKLGFLRSTAIAFVKSLKNPFPFFDEEAMKIPPSGRVSSEDLAETLQDLHLVAGMLANRRELLKGDLVRSVLDAFHRIYPDLGLEATEARNVAAGDVDRKAQRLLEWMERVEDHVYELAGQEGLESDIHESLTLDELRRELGV